MYNFIEILMHIICLLCRGVVERAFGILKRRFPCLTLGLRTKLDTTYAIIVAVVCLHNMAVRGDEPLLEDEILPLPLPQPQDQNNGPLDRRGNMTRRRIIQDHFD